MRKLLVIALGQYKAAVKTKAFVISLVLVPVLWTLSIGIQVLLHRAEDRSTKKFAIVDRTADKQVTAKSKPGLRFTTTFGSTTGRRANKTGQNSNLCRSRRRRWTANQFSNSDLTSRSGVKTAILKVPRYLPRRVLPHHAIQRPTL